MGIVSLIVAMSQDRVIGDNNKLPWPNLKDDMARFKNLTEGWPVIIGRNTYESIPAKFKPLRNRMNCVISRSWHQSKCSVYVWPSLIYALTDLKNWDRVWIIGGGKIYQEAINQNLVDEMWVTKIDQQCNGDTLFPEIDENLWDISHDGDVYDDIIPYSYYIYKRRRNELLAEIKR